MLIYKHFNRFCLAFGNLNISSLSRSIVSKERRLVDLPFFVSSCPKKFHTTPNKFDLKEFFDDEENWDKEKIQVGRSWKLDELRIKSNVDLHKLWFILLKEKNMLLTMEHEYNEKYIAMPNPERIDKVNESMKNLETVVRERNKAYHLLETGETGERPIVKDENCFGLPCTRKLREHYIEKKYNAAFRKYYKLRYEIMNHKDVDLFLRKYNEKQNLRKLALNRARFKHVCGLFRRFSNIDEEALKEEYPDVDIEKAKRHPDARGPRLNPY